MRIIGKALCGGAALLIATAALAQDPSIPKKGQDTDPKLPPPSEQIPEKVRPTEDAPGSRTLSEKLEQSDGVIKPPSEVDPEIKTIPPAADTNAMPVIKPPGNAK